MKIAVNEDGHVLEQIKTHPKEVEKEDARVAGAHIKKRNRRGGGQKLGAATDKINPYWWKDEKEGKARKRKRERKTKGMGQRKHGKASGLVFSFSFSSSCSLPYTSRQSQRDSPPSLLAAMC